MVVGGDEDMMLRLLGMYESALEKDQVWLKPLVGSSE